MSKRLPWRERPRHIAQPCAGCGVVIIGTSLRAFDEARAEHYAHAHDIPRVRT